MGELKSENSGEGNICLEELLEKLRARSSQHFERLKNACYEYIALKREYEKDEENFKRNIDKMVLLHVAYQNVRQNMIMNPELTSLTCDFFNQEGNTVNKVAETVVKNYRH